MLGGPTGVSATRRTAPWTFALLAMLLGGGALVIGIAEPAANGVQRGFVATTVGLAAIAVGIETVRRARRGQHLTRLFGRLGAVFGGIGTALMAYAFVAFAIAPAGVVLPALSVPIGGSASSASAPVIAAPTTPSVASSPVPAAPAPGVPAAADDSPATDPYSGAIIGPWVPTSAASERLALAQSAGSLATAMRQRFGTAGPFPSSLATGLESPQRITLPTGEGLAPLPNGAKVTYEVSIDRQAWRVTIVGASFGGVVAFDSDDGLVRG